MLREEGRKGSDVDEGGWEREEKREGRRREKWRGGEWVEGTWEEGEAGRKELEGVS